MKSSGLSLAAGAFVAAALALLAQEEKQQEKLQEKQPSDFIRFTEGEKGEGKLETAIVTFKRADGASVDLIAAVHVADAAYYKGLQRRFESYDRLLYEMVKPKDAPPPGPAEGDGAAAREKRPDSLLSFFQRAMKDTLGLQFQLDAIDYSKKNFVHADLDPDTFFRLQREKGESILGLLWKTMLQSLEREASGKKKQVGLLELMAAFTAEDSERKLKLIFARELEDIEMILAGFEKGTKGGSVIVVERNKVVIQAVRDGLADGKKKLGVFYGGGHMQDLEKRLIEELGLKKSKEEWVTAWDIRKKQPPGAGAEKAAPGTDGK